MDVEEVYLCGDCGEDYNDIMEARACCAPTPETAYVCGHCDKQHRAEDDALEADRFVERFGGSA